MMAELWHHQVHTWVEFYLIVGGAAGALTGLMFVVVSVGPHVITERTAPQRRAFITPVLVYFVCALSISACMTMPTMTPSALATLLLLGGVCGLGYVVWIRVYPLWRAGKLGVDDLIWYVTLPIVGFLALVAAAVAVAVHIDYSLEIVALAALIFLVTGIRNSWDLILWMAQRPKDGSPSNL